MRRGRRSAWNSSPDIGFDRAVNPYRGCEHGCIYCYARPTHAYLGYSPGLDFETKLIFKPEVAELLEKELRKPGYTARTLALGSNTDPYQPVERTLKLTRAVLQVLDRFNHPVGIVTKSAGVLRDLDILTSMAQRKLARVYVSVTTLDAALARVMEPRAATPARRLHAIAELTRAGVPAGVMVAPMIPGLNDAEMEKIVEAAARAGARHAGYVLLRLPHELRQMFEDWLATHFPDRAKHVLNLIRDTRSGALSDARFHHRFRDRACMPICCCAGSCGRRANGGWMRRARDWIAARFAVPDDGRLGVAQAQMIAVLRIQRRQPLGRPVDLPVPQEATPSICGHFSSPNLRSNLGVPSRGGDAPPASLGSRISPCCTTVVRDHACGRQRRACREGPRRPSRWRNPPHRQAVPAPPRSGAEAPRGSATCGPSEAGKARSRPRAGE